MEQHGGSQNRDERDESKSVSWREYEIKRRKVEARVQVRTSGEKDEEAEERRYCMRCEKGGKGMEAVG
jgi:hypothetical protein